MKRLLRLTVLALLVLGAWGLLKHPQTPLPAGWNPTTPFRIADPITPLTDWKMQSVLSTEGGCKAALTDAGVIFDALPDFEASEQCHIRDRVTLRSVGVSSVRKFDTTCEIALRTALWDKHFVQEAAQRHLGTGISEMLHFASYNCRAIRTSAGTGTRMSEHATASAFDVSGFKTDEGVTITLLKDWNGDPSTAAFLRDVFDGACQTFGLVLGPEYNQLHADHFHMQVAGRWCR